MKVNNPHNNLFEKVMELPDAAVALVKHFFPKDIVESLDLTSFRQQPTSYITEELAPYFSDIIYACKKKDEEVFISILFEHKSKYELPDLQLLSYTVNGYKKQENKWKAAKKKEKNRKRKKFIPTLILPVLLYHGREKWQNKTFLDLFSSSLATFDKYVPSIEYVLVNLQDHTDVEIERIDIEILKTMLLLFKHKNDKKYVLRNFDKFFIFVQQHPEGRVTTTYLRMFILYIFQTFDLQKEEIEEVIPSLPISAKKEFMTTYDIAVNEGLVKGKIEGKIEGKIKGKLEMLVGLLLNMPQISTDLLSELTKFPKIRIAKLRKALADNRLEDWTKGIKALFKKVPNLTEKENKEIMDSALTYWQRLTKKNE
ncbi:MAG: Rpn family recombination-promoting nuclease/putative transposase [Bacteroidota bacterium]